MYFIFQCGKIYTLKTITVLETWEEAVKVDRAIRKKYINEGYELIEVPLMTVEKRTEFILQKCLGVKCEHLLKEYWGYSGFRLQQWEVIEQILNKEDAFKSLFPTGGGKSICYQIPGLLNDGLCLVLAH